MPTPFADWNAQESHIGAVGGESVLIDFVLTLDTAAYAAGDVMSVTQIVTNCVRIPDKTGVLQSIQVTDEADQGFGFDLVFLSANVSIGTLNAVVSVTDADARNILGIVSFASGDFIDLGGVRSATKTGVGLLVKPIATTRNIAIAAIARGAGTYTATDVRGRLGFLLD